MLDVVFGFGGRLNRLQYFMGGVALAVAAGLPMGLIAGYVMANRTTTAGVGGLLLAGLALLVIIPFFLWIILSMQARRFRDIGWNPVLVMPALFVVALFDQLVARAAPVLAFSKLSHQTPVGLLIGLASSCALLFWPGRPSDDDSDHAFAAGWPQDEDTPRAAPRTAAPARRAAADILKPAPVREAAPAQQMRPAPSGPPTFGRRGV